MPILPFQHTVPDISETAWISDTAMVIGDVTIGAHSNLWFNVVVRGDVNTIHIGANTNIQDGTIIHVTRDAPGLQKGEATHIGDNITIGHMALLHACKIEDDAFIGMKACIMDGVLIKKGAMIAAGALVTPGKTVGAHQLWAGIPARYVRDLTEQEQKMMAANAAHYVKLAKQY